MSGRHQYRSGLPWLFALLLAVGWHGIWFACLSGGNPRVLPATQPRPPKVCLLRAGLTPGHSALDPRVFPLPQKDGSARLSLDDYAGARFLSRPPVPAAVLLERRTRHPDALLNITPASPIERLAGPKPYRPNQIGCTAFPAQPHAAPRLHLQMRDGLGLAMFERHDTDPIAPAQSAGPWTIGLFVSFNSDGEVEHAFLDKPCQQPALNAAALHAVRTWRLKKTHAPRAGRVFIRYGR